MMEMAWLLSDNLQKYGYSPSSLVFEHKQSVYKQSMLGPLLLRIALIDVFMPWHVHAYIYISNRCRVLFFRVRLIHFLHALSCPPLPNYVLHQSFL